MNILVLEGGLQGISCGCSLYEKHKVSIVASNLMCRHSRFFKKVYAGIRADDESLFGLLEKEPFDVLLPVSDLTVPFASKNKTLIEEKYAVRCAVPDYNQVHQVEDKHRFMAFCDAHDIPHPKTMELTTDTLDVVASCVGFPSLIKPDYSVGARGIIKVNSLMELKEKYPEVSSKYGACTLQEFIENKEYYYNVMLYRDKEGRFLGYTILKIVRMYPVAAGSSSCCITVKNDALLKICKDCLDKLNWVGMADFDVLQRPDNGEYKIIEINPRVPASLRAAAVSGVNFPEIIVSDTIGQEIPRYEYVSGKVLRYMGIDIMWLLKSPRRFNVKPNWLQFIGKDIF